jgi:hypothetical protein
VQPIPACRPKALQACAPWPVEPPAVSVAKGLNHSGLYCPLRRIGVRFDGYREAMILWQSNIRENLLKGNAVKRKQLYLS